MFFAVCFMFSVTKKLKKSKTATIINPSYVNDIDKFIELHGMERKDEEFILYKRVSADFKTQEGTRNETVWLTGKTLEHTSWNPECECGEGKYYACPRPFFCDEFRNKKDDKYVAISVTRQDLHAHKSPIYPHKIAFRKGKVLYEVNKKGEKIG